MALLPNHVVPVLNALNFPKSLPTKRFTEDVTRPELWDFDLNLTSHELILYFSETMLAKSLDINQITLQK